MFRTLTVQVGMESEGFAIYDAMMQLKNEVIPSYYSCILLCYILYLGGRDGFCVHWWFGAT